MSIVVVTGGLCLYNQLINSEWSVTLIPCASYPSHCTAVNETPKSVAAHRTVKPPALKSTLWFSNAQNTFSFNFCKGLSWQSNKTQRRRRVKGSFIINRILAHIKVNDWMIVFQHCRGCSAQRLILWSKGRFVSLFIDRKAFSRGLDSRLPSPFLWALCWIAWSD